MRCPPTSVQISRWPWHSVRGFLKLCLWSAEAHTGMTDYINHFWRSGLPLVPGRPCQEMGSFAPPPHPPLGRIPRAPPPKIVHVIGHSGDIGLRTLDLSVRKVLESRLRIIVRHGRAKQSFRQTRVLLLGAAARRLLFQTGTVS